MFDTSVKSKVEWLGKWLSEPSTSTEAWWPYFRPSELTQTHRHKCLSQHSLPEHRGRDRRIYRSWWVSEPGISAESERPCLKEGEIWEPTLNAWGCPLIPTCAPWRAHTHHIHTRIDLRIIIKGPSTNSQSSFMAGDQSNWLTEPWSDVKAPVRMQWINDSIGTVIVIKTRGTQTPGTAIWSEPYSLQNTDLHLENSVWLLRCSGQIYMTSMACSLPLTKHPMVKK